MIPISPAEAYSVASNIREGENPAYTVDDFRSAMPAYTAELVPDEIIQGYIDAATAAVREARWHSLWKEGMRLYIAHFVTLYLETPDAVASRQQLANAGKLTGNKTSKSVAQVSVSYDNGSQATNDLAGWGAWKLTTFGTQFATLAKMVGKGGMLVR